MKNKMERITFYLTEQEKRDLKIKAMDNKKTLTQYIRGIIFPSDNDKTKRIEEINNILQKNGSTMTKEEREQLKQERERLKGRGNIYDRN